MASNANNAPTGTNAPTGAAATNTTTTTDTTTTTLTSAGTSSPFTGIQYNRTTTITWSSTAATSSSPPQGLEPPVITGPGGVPGGAPADAWWVWHPGHATSTGQEMVRAIGGYWATWEPDIAERGARGLRAFVRLYRGIPAARFAPPDAYLTPGELMKSLEVSCESEAARHD
ncbi:hypothetical protein EG328_006020 [Venturia inaequalis]|uniref:Uncharacterized protein n=1 Tax=Venturia inaequalis TaxID=5025 RepID=A0A8H3Z5N4_VENIN|nr:hypothetical protein EG328_006020 [Venturia inaequalis]